MGDGLGYLEGVGVCRGSFDVQFNNMGDALAVGDDLTGERGADLRECRGEFNVIWADDGAARS